MAVPVATVVQALARVSLADAAAFVRLIVASCCAASQQARSLLRALVAAVQSARTASIVCRSSARTTTRVYTIRYAPQRSTTTFFAVEYAIVDWTTEIIDHEDGHVLCIAAPVYAESAPHASIELFYPEYETIETTSVLDVAKLLAQKHVCSVTCQEITTKTPAEATETDDEATASESDDEGYSEEFAKDDITLRTEGEEAKAGDVVNNLDDDAQGVEEEAEDESDLNPATANDWPEIEMPDALVTEAALDWTFGVYHQPTGGQSTFGSVLLQRRLLGF